MEKIGIVDDDRPAGLVALLAVERLDGDHFIVKLAFSQDGKSDSETVVVHTVEEIHTMADRMASVLFHLTKARQKKDGEEPRKDPIKDKKEKRFNN